MQQRVAFLNAPKKHVLFQILLIHHEIITDVTDELLKMLEKVTIKISWRLSSKAWNCLPLVSGTSNNSYAHIDRTATILHTTQSEEKMQKSRYKEIQVF